MNEENRRLLLNAAVLLAVAVMSSLGTMVSNCSAGIATKGDVTKAAADLQKSIDQCARQSQLASITGKAQRGEPPTLADRLDVVELEQKAQAQRLAIEVRERVAFSAADWSLRDRREHEPWRRARDNALANWDRMALGRPPDQGADSVLRAAGVPR